jgi:hypothetical protein
MSRYALEWAKSLRDRGPEEKTVLLIVADYSEGSNAECTLLEGNLAREAGLSRSALRAVVDALQDAKLLTATVTPRQIDPAESKRAAAQLRNLLGQWGEHLYFQLTIDNWRPPARVKPATDDRSRGLRPTAVYRLYDKDEVLVYVGISSQPPIRFVQHRQGSAWWRDVVTREVEWYETRRLALAEEFRAITHDRPLFNKHHAGWHRT